MSEEATIRRGVRNARYTTVPNHVFEDSRLSMEARWLLGYLLSKPDDWTVRLGDIRKKGGCGRDKARAMVTELVKVGYAEKEPARKDGKFNGLCLVIYDEPLTEDQRKQSGQADESVAFLPQPEKPSTVQPSPANPPLVKTEPIAITESTNERERGREDGNPKEVERWLKRVHPSWPSFVADSAKAAHIAAMTLTSVERDAAADRMGDYLKAEKASGGRCAFSIYLTEKRWERLAPKAVEPDKPACAPAFGPVWAAIRMRDLVTGQKAFPPLKGWEAKAIEAGSLNRDTAERSARQNSGWPAVNIMHAKAAQRTALYGHGPIEDQLGKLCEFVPVETDCWRAWKAEHDLRGWPWLPDPGTMRGAYFPAGGPGGLEVFEMAVRGNQDDVGGREAAE